MTLPLAEFWTPLPVAEARFYLPGVRESSRTAGGQVLSAILGASLWRAEVTLDLDLHRDLTAIQAQVHELDRTGAPFLAHPHPVWSPAHDPTGAALAGVTPRLHTVDADPRRIRISGLPPLFRLRRGECLSFAYPGGQALHQVTTALVEASAAGLTPLFDVVPPVRPTPATGATTGAPVALMRPACAAVIAPGSVRWPAARAALSDGFAFEIVQTLGV